LQDEKYGDQFYRNNLVAKESFQRSSIKSINNQNGKLPKVEYRKTINSLKGFSETNVISPMTLQHRTDKIKQMHQISTNPALNDIFVDHLF
jgi:type IV secretory pathway component VirB8